MLTSEEIVRLARLFVAAGVDKIRLTGVKPDEIAFIELTHPSTYIPTIFQANMLIDTMLGPVTWSKPIGLK